MSRVLAALATLAIVASSFAVTSNVALGHEHRRVGPYTFVVGWINEPAYVNAANGLSLDVTETSSSKPVEGLATSLQAEVIVGGGAKKLALDERFESGPNTFDGVVSTDQLQFPDRVAANADLSARLDSMQTLVIAAIVIAGLALLASVGGLVTRRR